MRAPSNRLPPAWTSWLVGLVLAGAVWLAYRHTLADPFVFDDTMAIDRNVSIRRLWPPNALTAPPFDTSVSGRPLLNLSLAVNYAISGSDVGSYHLGNLLIHVLAALTLFGILRRTLLRMAFGSGPDARRVPADGIEATLLAFAVALLWAVHPLQTESITYLIQRAESLMGLFYLLTLYGLVRALDRVDRGGKPGPWLGISWLACLAGMATKEVTVSAPVILFLYDRTFAAGTFREAWRRRGRFYLALAATWILVGWLALGTQSRNGTAGFGIGVRWWDYFLTQFPALARYLRLSFWPRGLVFDYGAQWVAHPWSVLPAALLALGLVAFTVAAFCRPPQAARSGLRAAGFAGLWFFAILAPTSLIPGNRQTIAEHRMYLALAPLLAVVAVTVATTGLRGIPETARRRRAILVPALLLAAALAIATARRNAAYQSNLVLWGDTVAGNPGNVYARSNLGNVLLADGQLEAALAQYAEALRQKPDFGEAHNNYGTALARQGKMEEAKAEYRRAIALKPEFYPDAHNNLGVALAQGNDLEGARREFQAILKQRPDFLEVRFNDANALARLGRPKEALAEYESAKRDGFDLPELHNNLGNVLLTLGRTAEGMAEFDAAVRLKPNYSDAYNNLGSALAQSGRMVEAVKEYQQAVWLRPRFIEGRLNLANALAATNRLGEAETQYREVIAMRPDNIQARNNLGNVLAEDGQLVEAAGQYEEALRIAFDSPELHNNLGAALLKLHRFEAARKEFRTALQLKPDYAKARDNLAHLPAPTPTGLGTLAP